MVNTAYWTSDVVVAHGAAANQSLVHMCMGVFLYDVLLSAPFDWQIVSGKRKLRWVHVAYFGTKLSMLAFCAGLLAFFWVQHRIDCQTLFYAVETFMGLTVFFSSVLLAFRTVCVYHGREQLFVKGIVAVMSAALLASWMQGVADVTVTWSDAPGHAAWADGQCAITAMKSDYWIKYVVTIAFDAAILFMTAFGVARMAGTSHVGKVLVEQGIVYFVVTLLVSILICTLTLLRLNIIMSLIAAMPQTVICVVCSCRLFRNLADGSATRGQSSLMSGGGLMQLDSNGDPLPVSMQSTTKCFVNRLFRYDSRSGGGNRATGAVPSFVSATTAGGKSPYERYPYTPAAGAAPPTTTAAPLGYFDIASAPASPQRRPAPPLTEHPSRDEVDFLTMMQAARRASASAPNTPVVSFAGLASIPSPPTGAAAAYTQRKPAPATNGGGKKTSASPSPLSISISVEQEQYTEDADGGVTASVLR